MINVGEKLRELRIANNLSQEAVAQKLGVTKATISRYENGSRKPSIEQLVTLAKSFQIPFTYFSNVEPISIELVDEDDEPRENEYISLMEYLKTIGYALGVEIANECMDVFYTITDTSNGKIYFLSERELERLYDSVQNYTKFLLQDILKEKTPFSN